ncbi:MAG: hypothetical protein KZQ93_11760 [Candidatus Thiodiazotropha sp. (ex Monitilora ramsayi)]|nr:hypothetical protein [Candidatus Thiodiazotropha sp. (ex Monitilora ramsayi)]
MEIKSAVWRNLWMEMQVGLSEISNWSRCWLVKHAGHYVHKDEPERVIEGVRWTFSSWQTGHGSHSILGIATDGKEGLTPIPRKS